MCGLMVGRLTVRLWQFQNNNDKNNNNKKKKKEIGRVEDEIYLICGGYDAR